MAITSTLANRNNFIRWNKVSGLYSESLLPSIKVPPPVASNAFDISQLSIESSFSFGETTKNGLFIKPDGTKLYALMVTGDLVKEYDFGTPFDASTLSFNQSYDPTSEDTDFYGISFSSDGTRMYLGGNDNNEIFQYSLSTAWDISTASYSSFSYFMGAEQLSVRDIYISDDGSKAFVCGASPSDTISEYDFGTNFNISTLSHVQDASINGNEQIRFDSTGTKLITSNSFPSGFSYYDVLVPFDVSSLSLNQTNSSFNSQGVYFLDDGFTFFTNQGSIIRKRVIPNDSIRPKYGNESQYDDIDSVVVNFFKNDEISFYANLDSLEDNANFSSWRLDLVDAETFSTLYYGIGTLTKDIISGSDYRFYLDSLSIPTTWESGCYRMVIVDESNQSVLYISNPFKYSSQLAPYTEAIRFRNNVNILNFNYETLTSFKNEFRIRVVKRQGSPVANRIGYDLINGNFNPVRTTTGIKLKFVTDFYSLLDHEAWNSAIIQDLEIYNDETGTWESFTLPDGGVIEIEYEKNYPLGTGQVTLEQDNTYNSNKNV